MNLLPGIIGWFISIVYILALNFLTNGIGNSTEHIKEPLLNSSNSSSLFIFIIISTVSPHMAYSTFFSS